MEPGLRDREYLPGHHPGRSRYRLQWSPVLETGNTPATDIDRLINSCNGARS